MAKRNKKSTPLNDIENAVLLPYVTELSIDEFLFNVETFETSIEAEAANLAVVEQAEAEAQAIIDAEAAKVAAQELIDNPPVIVEEIAFVPEHVEGVLKDMIEAVDHDRRTEMVGFINGEFDTRSAFELTKNPTNDKMQDNLKSYRNKLTNTVAAAVLVAIDIDPQFLNREISSGSKFNVYAIDKVSDVVRALGGAFMTNAINKAVMQSLFAFRAAGVPFTGVMAAAAASDKIIVDKAMQALLVRHTVSAATAPTQSSSTMNALQVLGVVINRGSQKFPQWSLTDTPQTRRLEEALAA